MKKTIRVGSRRSPMAMAQTREVVARLERLPGAAHFTFETVGVSTVGDEMLDRPLADIGGKGLFVKALERELLSGRIDLAVHSLKDVEVDLPEGLGIVAIPPRDDPRDAFVSLAAPSLDALPGGARIGTSSPRRRAQLKRLRPDLEIISLRGNANSRLSRLGEGGCEALVLAVAGLARIGRNDAVTEILPDTRVLPAVSQGALGVECRLEDNWLVDLVAGISCERSAACVNAERGLLASLGGSCHTPIAALADYVDGEIVCRAELYDPETSEVWAIDGRAPLAEAEAMGVDLGLQLRTRSGHRRDVWARGR